MARHGLWRRGLMGLAVLAGMAAMAPAAAAAITPSVSLDQSAGKTAGSTANLGLDLRFAPTGSDSPRNMTLSLPAGLLANASIDHGACLTSSSVPNSACQVGTGTVTATAIVAGLPSAAVSVAATYDLVAPPAASDLAGLAVIANGKQLGGTAGITVRPATDPAGVGLNIAFTNLPNTFNGVSIGIDEIKSTFNSLRYPTSCPSTPAGLGVSANSYDDATMRTASAPLPVTGCSSLPFSPGFKLTAVRDSGDNQAKITTDITQTVGQATSRSVELSLPVAVLAPNLAVAAALCANPSSGACQPVGSTMAVSPLYPKPLNGEAYLTGSFTATSITLVFPPPFSLTLTGQVSLATNSTTFSGVPDFPLTDLQVVLDGGAHGVFQTSCTKPSGTATSTLTSQNGDKTVTVPANFTVANCHAPSGGSGPGKPPPGTTTGAPTLSSGSASGLLRGSPAMRFKLTAGKNAPKLTALTIAPPKGLRIVRRRVHGRLKVTGVSVKGARVKSLSLSHGRLLVKLRGPVSALTVKLGTKALAESAGLQSKAQHSQVKSLKLMVIARDAKGKLSTVTLAIRKLGFAAALRSG